MFIKGLKCNDWDHNNLGFLEISWHTKLEFNVLFQPQVVVVAVWCNQNNVTHHLLSFSARKQTKVFPKCQTAPFIGIHDSFSQI